GRAGGGRGLAGRRADRDPAGPGDVAEGTVVEHAAARVEGGRVADPDGPEVVAGEAGGGHRADRLAARGRPGAAQVGAVPGGEHVVAAAAAAGVEPGRAARPAVEGGVAAAESLGLQGRAVSDPDSCHEATR